jgi:hypothetical protein
MIGGSYFSATMNTATAKSTPMRAAAVDIFLRLQNNREQGPSISLLEGHSGHDPLPRYWNRGTLVPLGSLFLEREAAYETSLEYTGKTKVEATSSNSRGHTGDVNTSETPAVRQSHRQKGRSRLKRLVAHQNIQLIMFGTRLVLSLKIVSTIKSLTRR